MLYFRSVAIDGQYIGEVEVCEELDTQAARNFNDNSAVASIDEFLTKYRPTVYIHELNIRQEVPYKDRLERVVRTVVAAQGRGMIDEERVAYLTKKFIGV